MDRKYQFEDDVQQKRVGVTSKSQWAKWRTNIISVLPFGYTFPTEPM